MKTLALALVAVLLTVSLASASLCLKYAEFAEVLTIEISEPIPGFFLLPGEWVAEVEGEVLYNIPFFGTGGWTANFQRANFEVVGHNPTQFFGGNNTCHLKGSLDVATQLGTWTFYCDGAGEPFVNAGILQVVPCAEAAALVADEAHTLRVQGHKMFAGE